jgi:DnaJ-class molecular chaperone
LVFCDKCGTELPQGANFCFKCGSHQRKPSTEEFSVNSEDLVKKIKDLLHEGNVSKIIVRDEQGKLLLEVPATAGVIGVVLAPWLAAVGAIAALVARCTISVERKE